MFTTFRFNATHMHFCFSALSAPEGFAGRNVHSSTAERTWERTRLPQETRPTSGHRSQILGISRFDVVSGFRSFISGSIQRIQALIEASF